MKKINPKEVSYKLDWMTIPIRFRGKSRTEEEFLKRLSFDLEGFLASKGYFVRDPKEDDKLTLSQGYDQKEAKIIKIGEKDYTLNRRKEYEKPFGVEPRNGEDVEKQFLYWSGIISLSGNDLENMSFSSLRKLLKDLKDVSYITRLDVACDITYESNEEVQKMLNQIGRVAGFTIDYEEGNKQNPMNRIASGDKNKSRPIKTASKTLSNGTTVYIGGRQSKTLFRFYDKTAEILSRSEGLENVPPILRAEIEVKAEIADASIDYILNSKAREEVLIKNLWHHYSNSRLTIKKNIDSSDTVLLSEYFKIGRAREISLDYRKIEGDDMSFEKWISSMVVPKFHRENNQLTPEEKSKYIDEIFLKNSPRKEDREYFKKKYNQ